MQNQLSELLSARICHDLISPVGAIGNGVELISELSGTTPELELIGQSAQAAQAKLKFFRVAFGASGGSQIGGAEARRVASDMFSEGRLRLSFAADWGDRERGLVKLFYLVLLCAEASLPRGGTLTCAPTVSGWALTATSTPVAPPEALWDHALTGAAASDLSAKTVQFALLRDSLLEREITLSAVFGADHMTLEF